MKKQEFLNLLKSKLSGLPKEDIEERISFYEEMIDDRTEEGIPEEQAVADIGTADEVYAQIVKDIPLTKIVKERIKPKRQLKAWEIVLLSLGSPIWLSLAVAAVAVIFSLYVVLWSVVVSLWAVFASFVACAVASVPSFIIFIATGNTASGFSMLSAGAICAGLSIFTFYGCKTATASILVLTKKIAVFIKKCFIKKENLQ